MNRRTILAAPLLALAGPALAQGFPSRPVRLVVPYPPGGGVDGQARALARPLAAALGGASGRAGRRRARRGERPCRPTAREAGVNFDLTGWQGMVGPAGLPRPIVERVNAELRRALADPDVARRIRQQGNDVAPSTPEELATVIAAGREAMGGIIRAASIRAE